MYHTCTRSIYLAALLLAVSHAAILVRSPDGSFVPWELQPRAPPAGWIAIALKNYADASYLATVQMGTPPQEVQMAVALSQDFIAVASPPSGSNNDSAFFQPGSSSSFLPGNDSATTNNMSGANVTGRLVGELCTLKSAASPANFTYNATLLLTDPSVTNAMYPANARGILGYGVQLPSNVDPKASLLGSYLTANFTSAVCGIELNHFDDPVPDGVLRMGGLDQSSFTGNFSNVTVPQDSRVSWSIPFDQLGYLNNGQTRNLPGSVASIDVYHDGIQVSTVMARQIYSGIPGSQPISDTEWSIPCASRFPLTLTFAGRPFVINERDTVVKLLNGSCRGVVTGGALGVAQVGAPFLRNVYTQFGAQKAGDGSVSFFVGFATKKLRQSPISFSSSATATQAPSASRR